MNHRHRRRVNDNDQVPIVTEYSTLAPVYDRQWAFYVESTVRETMARLSLPPQAAVLDVGCGTGVLLEAMAKRHPQAQLSGVDPVQAMLETARGRLPPDIALHASWAEALPFRDGSFDLVVSNSAFHYFRQPLDALHEMRRVLRPGGQLVITDWCRDYLLCRLYDIYFRLFSRAHHRVYSEREILRLFEQAGYRDMRSERYRINWRWGLMTAVASAPV